MRNQLHLRNESITREEMNNNMKSGQFFYEQVVEIYNDPTQCTEPISPEIDDSPLDEIQGTFHWTEAKAKFNSIVKLYESARRVWKTSGNHGDFAEYTTADYLLHLHAAVEKYPGCLSQLCSKLPEEHFNESTNGSKAMPPRYQSGNTTRERKRNSDTIEFIHSPEVVELSKKKMKLLEEQFERQKEKAAAKKKEKEEKKKEKEEKKKERKEKEERKKQKERTEVLSKKFI
ncbi:unnamed protein product [Cylindrotheca closterium]|uniref:Uncharacterized protein n=1 Tax=Cylindrotheca closterium TaxID=2856 RepID=A0AAD2JLH0_9STRA|nr:unnamed protein product [Cylindrotheca closterium]